MTLAETLLAGFALGMLALHLGSVLLVVLRSARAVRPHVSEAPRITLLRPVCGVEPFDRETLGSSFALDYPTFEIIFCVADPDDPAAALVEDLIAAHPQVPARLLVGDCHLTANPKLNNLAKGWDAARGDLVVMADSNLLLPPDYLRQLVGARAPDVGLVSCPPIGIRPAGAWGALECAFLNGNQARLQLAADALGLGFAQGKTMMWDRAFLERHGGLRALGNRLAEDVAATCLVRRSGLRVALPHKPFAQPVGRRTLGQVWRRQLRWSKVRREGFPMMFLLEPLNGPVLPLIAAGLACGPWAAATLAALWYGAEIALSLREGWPSRMVDVVMFPVRDLMLPAIWLATLRNTRFEWRGNAMGPGALTKLPG
ncbi:glycosyltransferase [Tabrizicola piscis]|uniref:Glycosyltransferase n=1 Tax=Tabrizicola piscis TaxID=2494374 RepID=A0A3S8U920_9RHOB|nr:ceramide glucosyltransferase [Tabrizicola piscis]AZL60030.1 glycosyltransferase [Tabrizicola piscis]